MSVFFVFAKSPTDSFGDHLLDSVTLAPALNSSDYNLSGYLVLVTLGVYGAHRVVLKARK